MIIDEEVYLEHFGIKGMKWGVRKGKDTAADKQAKREKKAQKFVAKSDLLKTKIKDIDTEYFNTTNRQFYRRQRLVDTRNKLVRQKDRAESNAEAKRKGKLSSTQKKVIVGATLVAVFATAVTVRNLHDTGELNRLSMKGKAWLDGKSGPTWKKNLDLGKEDMNADEIMDKVVRHVNPNYGKPGTVNNCRRATFAYEMRRRGFDVQATKTASGSGQTFAGMSNAIGFGRKDILKVDKQTARKIATGVELPINSPAGSAWRNYGNVGQKKIPSLSVKDRPKAIFDALAKEPNRSRGELGVLWDVGGGHSLAYEIIDNKPVIFDTQSGKKFSVAKDLASSYSASIKEAGYTRLDDVPLNENFIMRWVKNAD